MRWSTGKYMPLCHQKLNTALLRKAKVIPAIEVNRNYGLIMMKENGLTDVEKPKKPAAVKSKIKKGK